MIVKALRRVDEGTGKYQVGETFEVEGARGEKLISLGLVESVTKDISEAPDTTAVLKAKSKKGK